MTTTKITRLTLLLLFASSVAAQEAKGYGVIQGINCYGKEYVCVGPLNFKHCEWDAQGNTYASGSVIQCPPNHRCVNDGVEICIPLKLSTTAPQAARLITSEQIPVNSISTEAPVKIEELKWESTSAIPDTTTDIVVNKEPSSIPVDTTTVADGSIWTTFLTENPNSYNTLEPKSADPNFQFATSAPLETTTDAILETTSLQYETTTTSDTYVTLTPITSDDSSVPVNSNNVLETGSKIDDTHIAFLTITPENQAYDTTTFINFSANPNSPENSYLLTNSNISENHDSTMSTVELSDSTTEIYHETTVTANLENYVEFETEAPIDASPSISPESSTVTTQLISLDSNTPVDPSESNLKDKTPVDPKTASDPSALPSQSLPVEQNAPVNPKISINLSASSDPSVAESPSLPDQHNLPVGSNTLVKLSSTNLNTAKIPVDETNSIIPSDPSSPSDNNKPASSSLPVNSNIPNELSAPTDPTTTTIPIEESNTIVPSASSEPNTSTSSSLPENSNIPIELTASTDVTTTAIPVEESNSIVLMAPSDNTPANSSLPENSNIPTKISGSTDLNTANIPVDKTNSIVPSAPSDNTPASSSLPENSNIPTDSIVPSAPFSPSDNSRPPSSSLAENSNIPNELSTPTNPTTTTISVEEPNTVVPSAPTEPSTSISSNLPVNSNIPIELNGSTDLNTANIPVDKTDSIVPIVPSDNTPVSSSLPVNSNIPMELGGSTDLNTANIPVDKTNSIVLNASSGNTPASSNLPVNSNISIELSGSTGYNSVSIANPSLPVERDSSLGDANQIDSRDSINKNETSLSVDLSVPKTPSNPIGSGASTNLPVDEITIVQNKPLENNSPSRNQPAELKAPSDPKIISPISHITSTNLNHVRPNLSVNPNTIIKSNGHQPNGINVPTDFSPSAEPNTPSDHTLPIHSSILRTVFTKLYLHSRNKGSNANGGADNGFLLLPRQTVASSFSDLSKKSIPQEPVKIESSEINSSKSGIKDEDSIEVKSKENSKKSKRPKNSRDNKQNQETEEGESVEVYVAEKSQNKDTSLENKSGANSKESKDNKDLEEKKFKVERKPDDEDDESSSSEQKEIIKKIVKKLKDSKCDEDDIYPDPKDCKKFYRCVKKDHKTRITHLRCESGDRFDSDKLKCVDKRKAKCLSKEDFIEEFA
ncbi:uncharacterized protein LOC126758701 isoform X3 [Bactrocera neohumeralis]|uniref:uncharacterized protein LOC126758701 isoform X3 n=1 Tax=Bactrocera neohumeralis TaxID=98809 RepID=UPI0021664A5D|nr:uncharacterized protein LOC126758701 isoform X3 [Bactrocera neohumeralis]